MSYAEALRKDLEARTSTELVDLRDKARDIARDSHAPAESRSRAKTESLEITRILQQRDGTDKSDPTLLQGNHVSYANDSEGVMRHTTTGGPATVAAASPAESEE